MKACFICGIETEKFERDGKVSQSVVYQELCRSFDL